jgi:two-component system, OmpR family, sensor histidine kinase BaeS
MSLRHRFILSHILPILVILPLIGAALIYLLETQVLLQDLSAGLTQQAVIIGALSNGRPDIWTDNEQANAFLSQLKDQLDSQVTLLAPSGGFLAASETGAEVVTASPDMASLMAGRQQVVITYRLDEQSATIFVPVINVNNQLVGIVQVSDELASVANSFSPLARFVVLVMGAGLILGLVVGLILAARLEKPIVAVTTAVADIAYGRRTDPISATGTKETKELAQAANLLAARLRELEETRRRLLANLVHELGRPLGALKAAVNVLREGAGDDIALREEFLAGMDTTISQMEPLLDDLARLHGQILGNVTLNRQEINLSEWLPPLLLPWRAAAQEKGLRWHSDIPASLTPLPLDRERLGQAIGNLLSNAIKYTPAGGIINVRAGETGSEIWLSVTDSGPGIAADEQEQIFEPFYRSHRDRRFPQGLGLGLTIAKEIVVGHNGRLTLQSAPGEGSAFTIHLPK